MSRPLAPTLDDVARAAGVSRATASRAVRGGAQVKASTQAAIDRAVRELGYVPNLVARSLATKRTDTIAVIVSEPHTRLFADPFFPTVISGIAEKLAPTDLHMSLLMGDGEYRKKLDQYLRSGRADAAIIVSHHDGDNLPGLMKELRLPHVFLGRPIEEESEDKQASSGHTSTHFIDLDNVTGGYMAAEHLIERGSRNIAMITGPMDIASSRERLEGARSALAHEGIDFIDVQHGTFEEANAHELTQKILRTHPHIDGLFVGSDRMAVAALSALRDAERMVPADIRVVGFDNAEFAALSVPTLTTITNPWQEIAQRATDMLLAQLEGEPVETPILLQPTLIKRQSS